MAKVIDRAALGGGFAVICYLYFLGAWGSIPLACAAAFACCVLAGAVVLGSPVHRRVSAAQAQAELAHIAAMNESEATTALEALFRRRFPNESFSLYPILKHPEATMNVGDVLNAWKANRDSKRLVIAATCPCEPRAALYARELTSPSVAVVDSRALYRILRALPADALPKVPYLSITQRLRRLAGRVACARITPRNALIALALLAGYLVGGSPWHLFASLAVLLHMGIALIQRRTGRRLFDE